MRRRFAMQKLTRQDLHDILYGCAILGTGGGGSLKKGLSLIDRALDAGKEFILVGLDEVPDEALIACPYICGSISPLTGKEERKYAGLPRITEEPPLCAFKALEEYLSKEFYGVLSPELGGENTAQAFYVAASLGRYIVDADPAGRSVPECQHSTLFANGVNTKTIAVATEFGDVAIVTEVVDALRAEALVRAMAVASKNVVGAADYVATGGELKGAVIPDAISYALKIGRTYREAKEGGRDVAAEIAAAGGGFPLFKGKVRDFSWWDQDGFTFGNTYIDGEGSYADSTYRIWFKNENIVAWRDDEIDVTVPDLICVFNADRGEPVINPHYETGMRVSVIGLPAPKEWRTERGLEVFGPKHFGYDIEYVPIEEKFSDSRE